MDHVRLLHPFMQDYLRWFMALNSHGPQVIIILYVKQTQKSLWSLSILECIHVIHMQLSLQRFIILSNNHGISNSLTFREGNKIADQLPKQGGQSLLNLTCDQCSLPLASLLDANVPGNLWPRLVQFSFACFFLFFPLIKKWLKN